MAPNRRMCNELVRELCLKIPTAKTADSILLTAYNVYSYLAPIFSKKLIYRDAIAFLRALLRAKKKFGIQIEHVVQNEESEPIVLINQAQSDKEFKLETNKFHVHIRTLNHVLSRKALCSISVSIRQFDNAQLHYFLCIISLLIRPIRLNLDFYYYYSQYFLITATARFLNAESDWIDSIGLWDRHFNSYPIYRALNEYSKLEIYGTLSPDSVPDMIHWLTKNNANGQPKKYLILRQGRLYDGLALLIDKLKEDFARATSKSRFVVRPELREWLDEFSMCNERTGEKLELHLKNSKGGWYMHALSRFPSNGLDGSGNDCAELDTLAEIHLH